MGRGAGRLHREGVRGQHLWTAATLLVGAMLACAGLQAQQAVQQPAQLQAAQLQAARQAAQEDAPAPPASATEKPYILHVYQNLMQIPTVVVVPQLHQFGTGRTLTYDPMTNLTLSRFTIRLDRGANFHPTHMHVEGEEPITLAIVVDRGSHPSYLLPQLALDLHDFVTTELRAHDHVSLYTMECGLIRRIADLPADSPLLTADAFAGAMDAKREELRAEAPCARRIALFDSLATVVHGIAPLPGRRVVLAVTRGEDHRSTFKWAELKRYAAGSSVAIFGLIPLPEMGGASYEVGFGREDPFDAVCELSGGLVLSSADMELRETLKNFIGIVRDRYILEFPRPNDGVAGEHDIAVTLQSTQAIIRPAGITVPLPDPSVLNDPTTVPSAPSPATYGKRRPMQAGAPK